VAAPVLCEVTANPTCSVAANPDSDSVPTWVQLTPSADSYPVTVDPDRTSLTHRGTADALPAVCNDSPPVTVRRWNATPFSGVTNIDTCRASSANDSRTITPAFAHGCVFPNDATRATSTPSPVHGCEMNRN
jgi:hypothetical protein